MHRRQCRAGLLSGPSNRGKAAVTVDVMTVETLRSQYRDAVVAWEEAQSEPARANRLFDRVHDLAKQVRQSQTGRDAIATP
jgi:hypothetical protein